MVAGPVGSLFGGLARALMGALFGGAAGCAAGSAVGGQIDEHVLSNYACQECDHVFSKPTTHPTARLAPAYADEWQDHSGAILAVCIGLLA
jgi:hypothetical protein